MSSIQKHATQIHAFIHGEVQYGSNLRDIANPLFMFNLKVKIPIFNIEMICTPMY